jgi:hypothetical protein
VNTALVGLNGTFEKTEPRWVFVSSTHHRADDQTRVEVSGINALVLIERAP